MCALIVHWFYVFFSSMRRNETPDIKQRCVWTVYYEKLEEFRAKGGHISGDEGDPFSELEKQLAAQASRSAPPASPTTES